MTVKQLHERTTSLKYYCNTIVTELTYIQIEPANLGTLMVQSVKL